MSLKLISLFFHVFRFCSLHLFSLCVNVTFSLLLSSSLQSPHPQAQYMFFNSCPLQGSSHLVSPSSSQPTCQNFLTSQINLYLSRVSCVLAFSIHHTNRFAFLFFFAKMFGRFGRCGREPFERLQLPRLWCKICMKRANIFA